MPVVAANIIAAEKVLPLTRIDASTSSVRGSGGSVPMNRWVCPSNNHQFSYFPGLVDGKGGFAPSMSSIFEGWSEMRSSA
jgi:hypothetical protein